MKTILAVASAGGHREQLTRITRHLENDFKIIHVSTTMPDHKIDEHTYQMDDFNRDSPFKIFKTIWQAYRIIRATKADVILTTGAAPGVAMILIGRLLRKRTIWVDSMANVSCLSLSGRLIKPFASRVYSQWKHLESKNVFYAGSVFGTIIRQPS